MNMCSAFGPVDLKNGTITNTVNLHDLENAITNNDTTVTTFTNTTTSMELMKVLSHEINDNMFENYRNVVEGFVQGGSYIGCDAVMKNEYEWIKPTNRFGLGDFCLDLERNEEAVFTLIGVVLPGSYEFTCPSHMGSN
ncbi:hypothetical protein Clacol_004244 [Clathrus columnatus]|uniref:Uncharacterized protein n=1 Tax=Clathrus columnatus TaxID=1419009 RepID=A0AAV5ABK8_9AGAM|nr:hypothetical protein Clacol_004244 [Clathrus columnatus]